MPISKYAGKGKPGPLAKQVVKSYRLELVLESTTERIEAKSGQGIPFSKGSVVHGGLGFLEKTVEPPMRELKPLFF